MAILGWIIFGIISLYVLLRALNTCAVIRAEKDPGLKREMNTYLYEQIACYSDSDDNRASALEWLEENAPKEAAKLKRGDWPTCTTLCP
jgi:hypothetical protein